MTVQQVNQLVKQFDQMRKLMRGIQQGKMPDLGADHAAALRRVAILLGRYGSQHATHPRRREKRSPVARGRRGQPLPARRSIHRDLGRYNPQTEPSTVVLDEERVRYWLSKGAQAL